MNRRNLLILFLLAFLSALLADRLISILPPLSPFFYLLLASLIFLGIFALYDRYLWRWFGIDKRPNINGTWLGKLSSSYQDNSEVEPIRVLIVQRWLTTRIDFIAAYASSSSSTSLFFRDKDGAYVLAYIFRSEPYEGHEEKVPSHIGLSVLRLVEDGRLSGYYHHLEATEDGIQFIHGQVVFTRP